MNLQKKSRLDRDAELNDARLEKDRRRDSLKLALQHFSKRTSVVELREWQEHLCAHLCDFLKTQTGTWAGYRALPQEPDLSSVYEQMTHLTWAFPRVQAADLHFHTCENFVTGTFGISEPTIESPTVSCEQLQGLLIPGLGFDKKGRRLGRGRGFYDRALAGYQGFKVGVAFDCQVIEDDLPDEEHDVSMNALVTETKFLIIRA